LDRLVCYDAYPDARSAIARENELKAWRRAKKNALVETLNRSRQDLGPKLFNRH
jgi:putative endonuclease